MSLSKPPEKHATRSNHVYEALKADIVSLRLEPGALVQEETLARRLGVSRTPVREALRRLEQDGLVQILPKKGIIVTSISISDIREFFQLRLALEPLAARLAAEAMPEEEIRHLRELHERPAGPDAVDKHPYRDLHRSIASHCGNRRLGSLLLSLRDDNARIVGATDFDGLRLVHQHHMRIVEALERRDGAAAEQVMREHIVAFQESFMAMLMGRQSLRRDTGLQLLAPTEAG